MSSKFRTGNNPFGGSQVGAAKGISGANGLDAAEALDSAAARLTNEIARRDPRPAMNTQVINTPNGKIISPIVRNRKVSSEQVCPLGIISGGKLSPGYITAGGDTIFLTIEGLDPNNGTELYVRAQWAADVEDNILLESGTLTSATIQVGSLPQDQIPTSSNPTGVANIPLGSWQSGKFEPSGCGSITMKFCPDGGNFLYVR